MRMIQKYALLMLLLIASVATIHAQQQGKVTINGQQYTYMIEECGDTLIIADLDDVSVSSLREFSSREDYLLYRRYRKYAAVVYPYAVEAVKLYREVEYATATMPERKRKKYVKNLHKELKEEFTDPLKHLTKTQGKILVKMVEKELDKDMHTIIKDLRNGLTASYWQTMGGMFGHDLKEGYIEGKDPIMDAVLGDMDISYEIPGTSSVSSH